MVINEGEWNMTTSMAMQNTLRALSPPLGMNEGLNSTQAAVQAGYVRIRPVIMTAFAMIIGMVPLSLGMGEGGEQNAPLGRAVIGGLVVATFATLYFVPCVFSLVHKRHRPGNRVGAADLGISGS